MIGREKHNFDNYNVYIINKRYVVLIYVLFSAIIIPSTLDNNARNHSWEKTG